METQKYHVVSSNHTHTTKRRNLRDYDQSQHLASMISGLILLSTLSPVAVGAASLSRENTTRFIPPISEVSIDETASALLNGTTDTSGATDHNISRTVVVKSWRDWVRHALTTDLFLFISLWATVALAYDFHRLWKKRRGSSFDSSKKWMKLTAILLAITVTLHYLDGIFEEVIVDLYTHDYCRTSKYIKAITGSFGFMFSYLVLWLRQRSIYCEPTMKHLTTPLFRASSGMIVVLIVSYPIVSITIYASSLSFAVVRSGCAIVASTMDHRIIWIYTAVTSAAMQSMLLGLFLLPLYKHKANMAESGSDCFSLRPIIVRSLTTAIICAVSDTGTAILAAANVLNDGVTIGVSMQISLLINLLMVVYSFSNWKKIILPFMFKRTPDITSDDSRMERSTTASTSSPRNQ